MSNKLTIGVDVDDVCADLIGEWCRRYNVQYDDSLSAEDIRDWDISKFVKPECGKRIFDILREPDFYNSVLPIPKARAAVELLRVLGHRVVFVTSCVIGTMDMKARWLKKWGFLPDHNSPQDFIAAADKSLVGADILVDDHVKNVEAFPGTALLVTRPHNADLETTRQRIEGLHMVPEWIAKRPTVLTTMLTGHLGVICGS